MVGVVDDGMVHLQGQHRGAHVGQVTLGGKLGRVDADHHYVVGVGLFELPQLR